MNNEIASSIPWYRVLCNSSITWFILELSPPEWGMTENIHSKVTSKVVVLHHGGGEGNGMIGKKRGWSVVAAECDVESEQTLSFIFVKYFYLKYFCQIFVSEIFVPNICIWNIFAEYFISNMWQEISRASQTLSEMLSECEENGAHLTTSCVTLPICGFPYNTIHFFITSPHHPARHLNVLYHTHYTRPNDTTW